jgi:hypothetical protein
MGSIRYSRGEPEGTPKGRGILPRISEAVYRHCGCEKSPHAPREIPPESANRCPPPSQLGRHGDTRGTRQGIQWGPCGESEGIGWGCCGGGVDPSHMYTPIPSVCLPSNLLSPNLLTALA